MRILRLMDDGMACRSGSLSGCRGKIKGLEDAGGAVRAHTDDRNGVMGYGFFVNRCDFAENAVIGADHSLRAEQRNGLIGAARHLLGGFFQSGLGVRCDSAGLGSRPPADVRLVFPAVLLLFVAGAECRRKSHRGGKQNGGRFFHPGFFI